MPLWWADSKWSLVEGSSLEVGQSTRLPGGGRTRTAGLNDELNLGEAGAHEGKGLDLRMGSGHERSPLYSSQHL